MNISMTWDVDPSDFIQLLDSDVSKTTLTLAEKIFYGIVNRTPVYTGNLRASWIADTKESSNFNVGGSKNNVLPAPIFPKGLDISVTPIIYIMNSTPYAGLVELGGPNNLPRAMVQNTLNSL